jgi:hypothetical protein
MLKCFPGFTLLGNEAGRMDRNESTRIVELNCDVYKWKISGFTRGIQLYLKVNADTQ